MRFLHDCTELPSDRTLFRDMCSTNVLALNVLKCYSMSCWRKLQPIVFDYNINGSIFPRMSDVRDVGVAFESRLSFNEHIECVISSAMKTLRFVMRNCSAVSSNMQWYDRHAIRLTPAS